MLRIPGCITHFRIKGKWIFTFRLWIIIFKIINHFFNAHSACRWPLSPVNIPPDITIRSRININRKSRKRIFRSSQKPVISNVIIIFCIIINRVSFLEKSRGHAWNRFSVTALIMHKHSILSFAITNNSYFL